jgi:hypothetical protein
MDAFRYKLVIGLLGTIGVVAITIGCAAVPSQPIDHRVASDSGMQANEGIIYGVVSFRYLDSSGREVDLAKAPRIDYGITTVLGPPTTGGATFAMVSSAGRVIGGSSDQPRLLFVKRFPAGENSMNRIDFHYSQGQGAAPLFVLFNVVPGKATYIGSLQLSFRGSKDVFGAERVRDFRIAVVDEHDEVTRMYKEHNPSNTSEIQKELMRLER